MDNQRLELSEESYNYVMNLTYSKYFSLLFSPLPVAPSHKFRKQKIKVKRVYLNHIPKIGLYKEHKEDPVLDLFDGQLKLYLQIFKDKSLVYSSTDKLKEFKIMQVGDQLVFEVDQVFEGDILFRIRHFLTSDIRYPVTRFMLNTCFMTDSETVLQKVRLQSPSTTWTSAKTSSRPTTSTSRSTPSQPKQRLNTQT